MPSPRSARWRRTAAITAACTGAALAAPSLASGAAHTYANGTLGAGGAWSNPATAVFMNFNRMSVTTSSYVEINFIGITDVASSWGGFIQDSPNSNVRVRARCRNANAFALSGYCTWYN